MTRNGQAATLLVDVGPATGGHGQRGIGRYVRGLASSITSFSEDLGARIWAVGTLGPTLDAFGRRALVATPHERLDRIVPWAMGRFATSRALDASRARVFHATDPQRPWARSDVPSVVTVYDLIPLHEREMLQSWRVDHQVVYRRYVHQIRSATRLVAISQTTSYDLQELLGIAPERIDIVYPQVDAPKGIQRIESPEPTFLFVGALDAHKQPELALRAFAQFHSRHGSGRLRFIGPTHRSQEQGLRAVAQQLGVSESISIEGRISDDALEAAYAAATALVSTSRIEGFGLPPIEAVLRNLPVVAVESSAATETLTGLAVLVPADADAIADAMAHPFQPTANAVEMTRSRYSISSIAGSLEASYRKILD